MPVRRVKWLRPAVLVLALVVGCDKQSDSGATNKPAARSTGGSQSDQERPIDKAADKGPIGRVGITAGNKPSNSGGKLLKVAVIPMGTTHDYWRAMHAGAVMAQRELGDVEIVWRGPEREDDRGQQVDLVQSFVSTGADAIVLAPLDGKALLPPVKQATAAGRAVVIVDSPLEGQAGKDFVTLVATDNYKGGVLAAERLAKVMGGKGKALLLRNHEGSVSTDERERGFVETIGKMKGIELIDPHRYAGPTRAAAQEASENLLTTYRDVQAVFCPNESSTFGMLLALRGRGLAKKVHFVGFDSSPSSVEALEKGDLDGLVVQNPMQMGYLGVKCAVDAIRKKKVQPHIDTGVTMVTRESLGRIEIRELLKPDLEKFLGT